MSSAARSTVGRRTKRRGLVLPRARRRRLLWQLGGGLTGVVVAWAVFWSPLFAIRQVAVSGARHTTSEDVARIADIDAGDSLLFVSPGEVERAVEELPWVKSAEANRRLFGTLRVKIVERDPAMVLRTAEGAWVVDATGRVLQPASKKVGLPAIDGPAASTYDPGDRVRAESVRQTLVAFGTFSHEVRANVTAASAADPEDIEFTLRGDIEVRYGSLDRMRDKAEVLGALLAQVRTRAETIDYIDVRVPASPALGTTDAGAPAVGAEEGSPVAPVPSPTP